MNDPQAFRLCFSIRAAPMHYYLIAPVTNEQIGLKGLADY
jgi:hypothetical protein